jgi:hypothetical protein
MFAAVEAPDCDKCYRVNCMEDATIGSRVPDDLKKWNFIARFGFLKIVLIKINIL